MALSIMATIKAAEWALFKILFNDFIGQSVAKWHIVQLEPCSDATGANGAIPSGYDITRAFIRCKWHCLESHLLALALELD